MDSRKLGAFTMSAIFVLSAFCIMVTASNGVSAYDAHANIDIDSDADCVVGTNGIVSGDGSAGNPFIITGWIVDSIHIATSPATPPITFSIEIRDVIVGNIEFAWYSGKVFDSDVESIHAMHGAALVQDCDITGGVLVEQLSPLVMDGCTLTGSSTSSLSAVSLTYADGEITDSTFTGFEHGIWAGPSADMDVSDCAFIDNDEGIHGMVTMGSISSCAFEDNGVGIHLEEYCHDVTITENDLKENGVGIELEDGCEDCAIFHNDFLDNTVQTQGGDGNVWDDGYPSGGNFWSDHDNTDHFSGPAQDTAGSDGIADEPYDLAGAAVQDRWPLTVPMADLLVVGVDVRPGSTVNGVNLKSRGQLPVAILGDVSFDVSWIDVSSLGIGGVAPFSNPNGVVTALSDVNGDGTLDLTVLFRIPALIGGGALSSSTTSLEVSGNLDATHGGIAISGTDSVEVK